MGWLRARLPGVLRRLLQASSLLFVVYAAAGGPWRNFKVAHNSRRLVTLMDGELAGQLYGANEDLLSFFGDSYQLSLSMLGLPWASTIFGVPIVDPVLALSQVVTTLSVPWILIGALVVPVLLAVLGGRVFCSHLCPMRVVFEVSQLVRAGLKRLGVPVGTWRSSARFGGWILLGGLLMALSLGSLVWLFILPYLSLTAGIVLVIGGGSAGALFGVVISWALFDALLAPGYFCHNVCPTGFVLEQLGQFKVLALKKSEAGGDCGSCSACETRCPYGLSPKEQTHHKACDSCGSCATVCPKEKLGRGFALPVIGAIAAALLLPGVAQAHHNKGLPHYGYFENYPQVPTDEYVRIDGRYEIGATIFNFQGLDRQNANTPNDVKIYLYIYDLKADTNYQGEVRFQIWQDDELIADTPRANVDEEAVYSTRETLPRSGSYTMVALLPLVPPVRLELPFYVDLASDRVNWLLLLAIGLPVLLVFALAVHGRKRRRQKRSPPKMAPVITALVALLLPALAWASECQICGMTNCTMEHYDTADGGQMMVMGGIPLGLFLAGVIAVLVISFVGVELLGSIEPSKSRLNLVKNKKVYNVVRSRWFQVLPQLVNVALFVFLMYAGLAGSRVANITPVAVWTVWWAGLIFMVALVGPAFCFACPWDGLSNLMTRLRIKARVEPLNLGFAYPKVLRNVYPAIVLFVALTWLELGYGVTTNPRTTAFMGLGVAALAVVGALLFDGKKFCQYGCPVGRISGLYANFSPVEIRARNPKVCERCTTEDCMTGNDKGYACPTGISLKVVTNASDCTMCTECFKSCDKRNVAFNIRPPATDLRKLPEGRLDEAWLAVVLLALTLFHGLSMTPAWENFAPGSMSLLKWMETTLGTPKAVNFSVAMFLVCGALVGLYWLSAKVGAIFAGDASVKARDLFIHFAYSLLPVALFYHLAHNAMHLLMEGSEVVPLLSDPLGRGSDYFGTAGMHIGSLIADAPLSYLQVGLILIGHFYGILVAHRIAHKLYDDRKKVVRSLVPMLAMMVLVSCAGLTLMLLDMNMRVGRM